MKRLSEAKRIEAENEEAALAFFRRVLTELPDPRRRQGVRYPFVAVVIIALMAMVCGSDDAEAMELWGEANEDWLDELLDLPHGPPTQDVFLAVFSAIEPKAFSEVFLAWVDLLRRRIPTKERHIAVDGKTSRRSFDTASGRLSLHTVSAWLSDEGLVLGQTKTADKSNEITAIPELLKALDLRCATVTIDAMGCQTEIARTITEAGGHYLLSVKENQPALHKDAVATFTEAGDGRERSVDERPRPSVEVFEETDKGHGRIEQRRVELCRDLGWMMTAERWPALDHLVKVTRERTVLSSGKVSREEAYYIGSDKAATAESAAQRIRRHWSIENSLHWVLDIAFREDEARHRAGYLAQNFSTLRHFALNLVKHAPGRRLGVANTRKQAGWDHNFLLSVLSSDGS